jgi:small-conductance mechanosensitive channel
MNDFLSSDMRSRPITFIVLGVICIAGTAGVWWLTSYLDTLTTLAETDRERALDLFRTRVLPVFVVVVLIGVAAGIVLFRLGLRVYRNATPAPRAGPARVAGAALAIAGVLMAAVPLAMLSVVLWMLRQA